MIDAILSEQDLHTIHQELTTMTFENSITTAGSEAKRAKNNLQARSFKGLTAHRLAFKQIRRNEQVNLAAAPLRISDLLLSKYGVGMDYGWHIDNPLMQSATIRTDLAFTLFLDNPASYEGGELIIDSDGGKRSYKLPAGSMILYPASFTHRVAVVRAGQRSAIVGWVQSAIRDPRHRDILYDLSIVRKALIKRDSGSAECAALSKSLSNLVRLWAEN